jgi:3-hydroxybutyryl-CoA dehydrogenase
MQIKNIGVIGGGIMGSGIAHVSALAGYSTLLFDIVPAVLESAKQQITANLQKGIDLKKLTAEQMTATLNNLTFTDNFEHISQSDFIIEAIPENMSLKIETFAKLDSLSPQITIFASNTSSLSITEMAAATQRPKKVIGMHFFNPVHKMKLIEIIKGLETDEETLRTTAEVGSRMGKETVSVRESPGFVTSRINALIGNEAFYMLQEGVASAQDIDKALKLGLNHPMGPFEMVDLVGLDTRLSILNYLHQTLGEKYRPAPLLVQYVKAGRLGRKTGKGVYEY